MSHTLLHFLDDNYFSALFDQALVNTFDKEKGNNISCFPIFLWILQQRKSPCLCLIEIYIVNGISETRMCC
jgi:hypothetical protein